MRLGRAERRDSLELLVCVVCRGKTARRVLPVPLDLLVLQEREESRVSPDPPASRVSLDPRGPLVKAVNLAIRVFQERLGPQGPPDHVVSGVSQEREEELGPRASRGLEVSQELQELMDPRVASARRGLQVLRGLRDCRGCLEREARPAFLDQRGTEVTTGRKDLKELLGKMAEEV